MDEIISIIAQIAGAVLTLAGVYIITRVRAYLNTKLDATELAKLDAFISDFVAAAEQQYKAQDATGEMRYQYVAALIGDLGYEITDVIKAKIESKVFEINKEGGAKNVKQTKK